MPFMNVHTRTSIAISEGCHAQYTERTPKGRKTPLKGIMLLFDAVILHEQGFANTDKVVIMPGQGNDFGSLLVKQATTTRGIGMRPYGEQHFVVRMAAVNKGWAGYEALKTRTPMQVVGPYEDGGIIFKIDGMLPANDTNAT